MKAGECRMHNCVHINPNVGFQVEELCAIIPESHRVSCTCRPTTSILPLDYTSGSDDGDNSDVLEDGDYRDSSQPVEVTGL